MWHDLTAKGLCPVEGLARVSWGCETASRKGKLEDDNPDGVKTTGGCFRAEGQI